MIAAVFSGWAIPAEENIRSNGDSDHKLVLYSEQIIFIYSRRVTVYFVKY